MAAFNGKEVTKMDIFTPRNAKGKFAVSIVGILLSVASIAAYIVDAKDSYTEMKVVDNQNKLEVVSDDED